MGIREAAQMHWELRGRPAQDDWADWFWAEGSRTYVRLGCVDLDDRDREVHILARRGQTVAGPYDGQMVLVYRKLGTTAWNTLPMFRNNTDYSAVLHETDYEFHLMSTDLAGSSYIDDNAGANYKMDRSSLGHGLFLRRAGIAAKQSPFPKTTTWKVFAEVLFPSGRARALRMDVQLNSRWITIDSPTPVMQIKPWKSGLDILSVIQAVEDVSDPNPPSGPEDWPAIPLPPLEPPPTRYRAAFSVIDQDGVIWTDDNFGRHYSLGYVGQLANL
jgi:hypothetical protein